MSEIQTHHEVENDLEQGFDTEHGLSESGSNEIDQLCGAPENDADIQAELFDQNHWLTEAEAQAGSEMEFVDGGYAFDIDPKTGDFLQDGINKSEQIRQSKDVEHIEETNSRSLELMDGGFSIHTTETGAVNNTDVEIDDSSSELMSVDRIFVTFYVRQGTEVHTFTFQSKVPEEREEYFFEEEFTDEDFESLALANGQELAEEETKEEQVFGFMQAAEGTVATQQQKSESLWNKLFEEDEKNEDIKELADEETEGDIFRILSGESYQPSNEQLYAETKAVEIASEQVDDKIPGTEAILQSIEQAALPEPEIAETTPVQVQVEETATAPSKEVVVEIQQSDINIPALAESKNENISKADEQKIEMVQSPPVVETISSTSADMETDDLEIKYQEPAKAEQVIELRTAVAKQEVTTLPTPPAVETVKAELKEQKIIEAPEQPAIRIAEITTAEPKIASSVKTETPQITIHDDRTEAKAALPQKPEQKAPERIPEAMHPGERRNESTIAKQAEAKPAIAIRLNKPEVKVIKSTSPVLIRKPASAKSSRASGQITHREAGYASKPTEKNSDTKIRKAATASLSRAPLAKAARRGNLAERGRFSRGQNVNSATDDIGIETTDQNYELSMAA